MLGTLPTIVSLILAFFGRVDRLADAMREALPRKARRVLTDETAHAHALAAILAERPNAPAELLAGMAYIESNYDPTVVSRAKGGRFCGPLQVKVKTAARCLELVDLVAGYEAGARAIIAFRRSCAGKRLRRKLDVQASPSTCALQVYAGGWYAIDRSTYPQRVRERQRAIQRAQARKRERPIPLDV